ncbi:SLC13 family permease [Trichlorobacter lovleyi]|uniref:SLC13 family permease n=1 Tax=Trichlorobacter lovleyi TaxID=313985 RepID=UPI003D0ED530
MSISALFTIAVVLLMLIALMLELIEADVIVFGALAVLFISGIITPKEALAGFSNQGMLTVAILFIVAYAAQSAGFMQFFADRVMGNGKGGEARSLLRMMIPVASLSAFLNNTPIVAMFTPYLRDWSQRNGFAPSKFLIPLSYATIFGGVFTLIGTSTNLVVSGLYSQKYGGHLGMFELGLVGIPCGIAGMLYLYFAGRHLLPDNRVEGVSADEGREYLLEVEIADAASLIGKTVEAAGLRNLEQLYMVEIVRNNKRIAPVKPQEYLQTGDRLIFTGKVEGVAQLQKIGGLRPVHGHNLHQELLQNGEARLVEVVVSPSCPMLGKTIKEGNFRARYDAAVLAVHRHGERLRGKLGELVLRPGDTLLLLTGDDFIKRWNFSREFYLVSKISNLPRVNRKKSIITFCALVAMVALSAAGLMDILEAAVLATLVLLFTRCITTVEARRSIELNVLIVIASSFGISKALEKTGAAAWLADQIIGSVEQWGAVGVLAAICLITTILTEVITNNAAAAVIFPIAMASAHQLQVDPKPFVIAIAISASASFATPIGYQTNMMVYGPGGYRAKDFLKVGVPLNIIYMVVSILVIPLFWKF